MTIQELINLIVNNGLSVVLVAFYLLKDYKFNNKLVETLQSIEDSLKNDRRFDDDGK